MIKRHIIQAWVILCFIVIAQPVTAQSAKALVNKTTVRLGEAFELKLIVSSNQQPLLLDNWFTIEDTFSHFEVIEKLPIDTVAIANSYQFTQVIRLISFDTGVHVIPSLLINTIQKQTLQTNSIPVTVIPLDVSSLKNYHPIKEIIDVEPVFDWWFWATILSIIILIFIFIYWAYKNGYFRKKITKPNSQIVTLANILAQLNELESIKHQPQQFYPKLIAICKVFTAHQLQLNVQAKTSSEYMIQLKGNIGNEPMQVAFFQLLRLSDAVKFAQFIPDETTTVAALDTAKQFVTTIHSFKNSSK
ncbi:MAG: BatD family protein [Chitinophagaceae bacterium]